MGEYADGSVRTIKEMDRRASLAIHDTYVDLLGHVCKILFGEQEKRL